VYDWHEQRYNFEVMSQSRVAGVIQVDVTVTNRPNRSQNHAGAA
jgi:hypothetical protein